MVTTAKTDAIAASTQLVNTAKADVISQATQLSATAKTEAIAEATTLNNNAKEAAISTATTLATAAKTDAMAYTDSKIAGINQNTKLLQSDSNGNIGIGTDLTNNPNNFKLAVNGTIGAKEIKVIASGWADYVFKSSYKLKTLTEVEQYINTNGHLPEVPSETEVKQKGVSVGDMQAKLLQKVEELTLYIIEQNKKIKELENRLNQQTSKQ